MEALAYKKLDKKRVKCDLCHHFCVIRSGKRGICGVRENRDGRLVSLVYPKVIATSIDPIEKKPLFHLKPGSFSYSIATAGCNLKCTFCQNADISQIPPDVNRPVPGKDLLPEQIVRNAVKTGCESISYTYTEPTVFLELALETAKLAKQQGLFNVFVTNGYMSPSALDMVLPYLDAANVDLKAFDDKFYKTHCKARIEPVKENIKTMVERGVLVEITTLLIPGLNDADKDLTAMAEYICREVGEKTPWHLSRFHPCYHMTDRPSTPVHTLERAHAIGKAAGLRYVYIGNLPGQSSENTYCHSCHSLLVKRYAYQIKSLLEEKGTCPECGIRAYGIY